MLTQAWLLNWLLQFQQAQVAAVESLALCTLTHDQPGEIDALSILGEIHGFQNERAEQVRLFEKALALSQSLGDPWRQARAFWQSGYILNDLVYWEKAVSLFRELGTQSSLAKILGALGTINFYNGNIELAQKYIGEAELLWQSNRRADIWGYVNITKSMIAFTQADYKQARALLQETVLAAKETGNRMRYLWAYVRLGYIAVRENNHSEARTIFAESAREFQNDKNTIGVVFTLEGLSGLFITVGKPELAARLIGWADGTREKIKDKRPLIEQHDVDKEIAAITAKIGNSAFEEAYDAGRAMTMDEAVAFALE